MFNTKCGCPFCKNGHSPESRGGWKSMKNKRGHFFGSHPKPTKQYRPKRAVVKVLGQKALVKRR